jgi:hypothetical protein
MRTSKRWLGVGVVGCGAIAVFGSSAIDGSRRSPRSASEPTTARSITPPRPEREHDGPLPAYRASSAELAVRNRVALAESAKLQQRARLARATAPTVPGTTWVSLGPTEGAQQMTEKTPQVISGRINDIAVDPRDPDVVYVATSGGGVWKTFDLMAPAGATWLPLSDTQPSLAAGALALDPDHPDTLYVGYGDFVHAVGNSVARTGDGGLTWSQPVELGGTYPAPSGLPANVRGIRALAVHGSRVLVGTDVGLFASTDAGAHFALVDLPNVSGNTLPEAIWSIVHVGGDHWLATGVTGCDEHSLPLGVRTSGQDPGAACRDGNNGEIWYSANGTDWILAALPTTTGTGRIDVATGQGAPPESTVAYAMVGSVDLFNSVGLWRSLDGGRTWSDATGILANPTMPVPDGNGGFLPGDCPDMAMSSAQSWYDQAIAVDPTNPDHVLVGGWLCGARTLNGTAAQPSWELVAHWLPNFTSFLGTTAHGRLPYVHADWQTAKVVIAGNDVRALVGTDGGLFTSSHLFQAATRAETVDWTDRNRGLATHLMYSVASGDPATGDPFLLFSGLQDNGTRYRMDPERPWVFDAIIGADGIGATVHAAASGTTYFASQQSTRLYCQPQKSDCGTAVAWAGLDFLPGDPDSDARPAAGDDSEPFFIHYGNVESDRDGQSVLTHTVGQVFANVAQPDGTPHFIPISQDLTSQQLALTSVAASSTIPGLYGASAASGFRGSGPSPAPFFVTTQGNTMSTWTAAQPVQPAGTTAHMAAASSIAFPPVLPDGTAPGQVYLGAFVGALDDALRTPPPDGQGRLYRTRDFGQTWTSIVGADPAHRLPNVAVFVVKYDPVSPTTIYAGTDLGVYVSLDDGATWDRMGDGLPMVPVRDLYIARNQEFIRVATFGRGLWEIYPSATASHGALGNGDYDRNLQIDWVDVAAMASRLGATPASAQPPFYSWLLDVSAAGHDPPLQAIDDADLTTLLAKLGDRP